MTASSPSVRDRTTLEPYQGLRPFRESDRRFFCGRKTHIAELLQRLGDHRFVAVVGLSGSGKSSLVLAGVIPELRADLLINTSSDWMVVTMTPGTSPRSRLSSQLITGFEKYLEENGLPVPEQAKEWARNVPALINSGSLGLVQAIETAPLRERAYLLVVIDQFEELFRYKQRDNKDEAAWFVQQILEAISAPKPEEAPGTQKEEDPRRKIYVVITMRSEYLGECAGYMGLAEAVNAGLYLTPRLNRDQLKEAIVEPANTWGRINRTSRAIAPELVRCILNDVANDQDQLPVLQHSLMRCWELGSETIGETEYRRIGGSSALDSHAEAILEDLKRNCSPETSERKLQIVKVLFKRITKAANPEGGGDSEQDGRRDPATLAMICAQSGFAQEEVAAVIEVFRQPEYAFLQPSVEIPLDGDSMIDITHESLIRKWNKLRDWVKQEAEAADAYCQLAKESSDISRDDVLSERRTLFYGNFEESGRWNANWAQRYGGNYQQAISFLQSSKQLYADQRAAAIRKKDKEAAEALRKKDEEAAAVLKAEQEKQRIERAKWRERTIWCLVVGVVAVLAFMIVISVQHNRIDVEKRWHSFTDLIAEANGNGPVNDRAHSALEAAFLAMGLLNARDQLEKHVPLNEWELFSAIRRSMPLNKGTKSDNDSAFLRGKCGVSLARANNLIALADHQQIRIWPLTSAESNLTPIWAEDFPGVECVRFDNNSKQLLAFGQSGHGPGEIKIFVRKDKRSFELARKIDNSTKILAASFAGNADKLTVLTPESLKSYGIDERNNDYNYGKRGDDLQAENGYFSDDGNYVVISLQNGKATLYRLTQPNLYEDLKFTDVSYMGDRLQSVTFSRDSCRIVTGSSQGVVTIQDNPLPPKNCHQRDPDVQQLSGSIGALACAETQKHEELVAAGTNAGEVAVFRTYPKAAEDSDRPGLKKSIKNSYYTTLKNEGMITSVEFSDDGALLATASFDGNARLFNILSGSEIARIPHDANVLYAAVISNNRLLSVSQDTALFLTGTQPNPFLTRQALFENCALVVSSTSSWAWGCRGSVQLWDGKQEIRLAPNAEPPDAKTIAGAPQFDAAADALAWLDVHEEKNYQQGNAFQLCVNYALKSKGWTPPRTKKLEWQEDSQIPVMAISSNGKFLATALKSAIYVFHARGDDLLDDPSIPYDLYGIGQRQSIISLVVSDNGKIAVGRRDGTVSWYQPEGEKYSQMVVLPKNKRSDDPVPTALAFSFHNSLLIVKSDRSIWFLPVLDPKHYVKQIKSVQGQSQAVVISPQGDEFATVGGNAATFFKIQGEDIVQRYSLAESRDIQSLSFSEDEDGETAVTSILKNESFLLMTHHLQLDYYTKRICGNWPLWSKELPTACN